MYDAKHLVQIAESCRGDVDLLCGRYVVDAKSMLGVFSLPTFEQVEMGVGEEEAEFAREKLESLKKELTTQGVEVLTLPFDVRDRKAMQQAVDSLQGQWKHVDVLINNAGLVIGMDKEHEGSLDEWDIVIDTNIKALLAMTRLIVPGMVKRGCGHVINIGSIAGDAAYAGGSVYCATKAAVKALSDGLRIDLVDTPVRVTNIKPGMVETNFSVIRFRGDQDKADAVYKGIRPLTGDDIADVVYYAASAPAHVQIAEVLVMPTYQATGTVCHRQEQAARH